MSVERLLDERMPRFLDVPLLVEPRKLERHNAETVGTVKKEHVEGGVGVLVKLQRHGQLRGEVPHRIDSLSDRGRLVALCRTVPSHDDMRRRGGGRESSARDDGD